jgi:hypothetical protein
MGRYIITTKSPFTFGKRIGGEVFVDVDELTKPQKDTFRLWMKHYPETVRDEDTRPEVVERPAPPVTVEFGDPLTQLRSEDIRNRIMQQYADERLIEYQVKQGLVDDSHNAALLADWIDRYGQGYRLDVNVDRAIRALRPQLHWQPLSEFTKRLAGF